MVEDICGPHEETVKVIYMHVSKMKHNYGRSTCGDNHNNHTYKLTSVKGQFSQNAVVQCTSPVHSSISFVLIVCK